jgi:hypothetical protein
LVEGEKLGEEVGFGGEAVGVEDGGVEGGVGVLERVFAGEFEGTVERAEAALDLGQGFGADSADLASGGGDRLNLFRVRGLRPREGVEDGFRRVAEVGFQFGAFCDEPQPVGVRLEDAEAVVVGEGEAMPRGLTFMNFEHKEYLERWGQ